MGRLAAQRKGCSLIKLDVNCFSYVKTTQYDGFDTAGNFAKNDPQKSLETRYL